MSQSIGVGAVIAGRYVLERVLGKGGMGVVFAANHMDLLEPRAIKLMQPELAQDEAVSERFLREARASARLKSEHVARVYDVARLDDGVPYIVMEYLDGIDLAALRKQRGVLAIEDAALYVIQACDALAEAHAMGLVHRDLKPGNLFLTRHPDGSPCIKVLDFGVSKIVESSSPFFEEITSDGESVGTPAYMAPEQMRGERDLDARADIWAIGVVLYVLLTGAFPFLASEQTASLPLTLDPTYMPRPPWELRPDLPRDIGELVLRCLERDRTLRPASIVEVVRGLLPYAPFAIASRGMFLFRALGDPAPLSRGAAMTPRRPASAPEAEAQSRPPSSKARALPLQEHTLEGPTIVKQLPAAAVQTDTLAEPTLKWQSAPRLAPAEVSAEELSTPPITAPLFAARGSTLRRAGALVLVATALGGLVALLVARGRGLEAPEGDASARAGAMEAAASTSVDARANERAPAAPPSAATPSEAAAREPPPAGEPAPAAPTSSAPAALVSSAPSPSSAPASARNLQRSPAKPATPPRRSRYSF